MNVYQDICEKYNDWVMTNRRAVLKAIPKPPFPEAITSATRWDEFCSKMNEWEGHMKIVHRSGDDKQKDTRDAWDVLVKAFPYDNLPFQMPDGKYICRVVIGTRDGKPDYGMLYEDNLLDINLGIKNAKALYDDQNETDLSV